MNADVLSTPADEVRAEPLARPKLLDPAVAWSLPAIFGRSLFPIVTVALLAGTMLWGPWVSLVLTFAWWRCVTWFG